ncbi:GbsR/MarR family transcriptional regulator [Actinokineospora iranica]|uniref:MarR family protein n=1 Tax=Actinokineospora iranica TaxID=1271860 RepID=A0A1G6P103_9PSEU|nr:MarR family transcriptional regulator [Actinokineospora iranica]SDC73176.1 MarR family protein [Actinokineospora iranica]
MTEADQEEAVARFVERFALLMAEAGMARMPARVFTRLLATDSGRLTATELADALQVSPAAISGAVRYLDQVGLVVKGREPGQRRDHYAVSNDTWIEAITNRDKLLESWSTAMAEGVAVLGADTPAGQRMDETRRFFDFLKKEMALLMDKWRAQEAAR